MADRHFTKITAIILVLVLAPAMAWADERPPIRIGVSLGLSGKYAQMAKMQERGFRLWETHVNANGGILGRKVELTIRDDCSDPDLARQLYKEMIEKERLEFLLGPYSSALTLAILPITETYGYPLLTPGASLDTIWKRGYKNVFGIYPPTSRYVLGLLELLISNGFNKLAIITTDPIQNESVTRVEEWANRLDMQIVLKKIVPAGTGRWEPLSKELRDSGAQGLIMAVYFKDAIRMRRTLDNIDWHPKALWVAVGPEFQAYYDQLGPLAENTFGTILWKYYDKLPYPGNKAFYDSFTATHRIEPNHHAAMAYAAGLILQAAIERAGSTDRKRIGDILRTMDIMTLIGRYGVDRTGMQMRHFALITQWINGREEVVWPPELSTAQPVFPGETP